MSQFTLSTFPESVGGGREKVGGLTKVLIENENLKGPAREFRNRDEILLKTNQDHVGLVGL